MEHLNYHIECATICQKKGLKSALKADGICEVKCIQLYLQQITVDLFTLITVNLFSTGLRGVFVKE